MHHETETTAAIAAKVAPPASVSLATLAGFQVSELVMIATLIYTVLMIIHKLYSMFLDWNGERVERRVGRADLREVKIERRAK